MRHLFVGLLAVLAVLTSSTSVVAGPRPAAHVSRAGYMTTADYCAEPEELAFLTLINDYRAQNGLGPLVLSQALGAASEYHSIDMATKNYFSHDLKDGTSWDQNIRNFGYTYSTALGENIAAGYDTAASVFAGWKASAGHNANMLTSSYKAIGIGRAYNASATYRWYWTTDFGGYVDAPAQTCSSNSTPTPLPSVSPTATPAGTATNTAQPSATNTAVPPTATNTAVPSTATNTAVPQPTATATVVPPTVTPAPVAVAYVSNMSGKSATRKSTVTVTVSVTVQDSSGRAVSGASVTIVITAPDGTTQQVGASTNGRGQVTVSGTVPGAGTYVASVASVDAGSKPYDPSRNVVNSVTIPVR